MPTGYTYKIKDGISFKDFALDCARAFGALAHMRENQDAPIPDEIIPSEYHKTALEKANAELIRFQSMTLEAAENLCQLQYDAEVKRIAAANKEDADLKIKYESMLSEVEKWEPPIEGLIGLKKFMIEQIKSSIGHDCGFIRDVPVKKYPTIFTLDSITQASEDIKYHTNEYAAEVARCKEKTEWIQQLKKSLP